MPRFSLPDYLAAWPGERRRQRASRTSAEPRSRAPRPISHSWASIAPVKAIAGLVLGAVTGAVATTGGAVVGVTVAGAVAGAAVTEVVTTLVGQVVGVVACALLALTSTGVPQLGPLQFAVLLTLPPEVSEELSVTENVNV